jgi:hypothetical protein
VSLFLLKGIISMMLAFAPLAAQNISINVNKSDVIANGVSI